MDEPSTQTTPYVGPEETVAEATVRAIVLGVILAVVMGAANTYVGLSVGMTVTASIPAAVVSMAILRGVFRRGTILENNIAQTIASTGESLAAGAIFTIPALVLVGTWQEFEFWPTTFIVMFGGLLGVVFMVPMRRALIVNRPDLVYPEGVACSEVLITGQRGGSGVQHLVLGLLVGAVYKFLQSGIGLIKGTVEGAIAQGRSVFYFGSDMSAMLIAVGFIVNLSIASQVFLGGAIGWLVAMPLLGGYEAGEDPVDAAFGLYASHVRYIGVGTMLVGGLYSIVSVRRGIIEGFAALRKVHPGEAGDHAVLRTERDLPLVGLVTIFILTALGTFALYDLLIGDVFTASVAALVMIVAAFLFVAVATYIVGLVGSSNSPVSGMTICALLIAAGVLMALGIRGDSAILATLGVAGVVCCAACTSGDIAQDLKTGILVGATPARQQWSEVIGVIIPAFFFAPVLTLLHRSGGIGEEFPAPQAALFASLAQAFFGDGELPFNMVAIGAVVGVGIIVADAMLVRSGVAFRLHVMPVAVGIYLPLTLSVPIFIGGLIRYFAGRARPGAVGEATGPGVLIGSGLIAGEALMGIGLAIPAVLGWKFLQLPGGWPLALGSFALIIVGYWYLASRGGESKADRD